MQQRLAKHRIAAQTLLAGICTLAASSASAAMLTFNADSAASSAATRDAWLTSIGIVSPQHLVNFESGFVDDQNISGLTGLFPGGLVITDTSSAGSVTTDGTNGAYGGSNPVGNFSIKQNERPYLELDFSASPVDYVGFRDIDHAGTNIVVTFVGGATTTFSIETTVFSGNSAEFTGIFKNDMPRITLVQLDASGDGSWGIDNIEYGSSAVPVPAAAWLFGSGLIGLVGVARRRK